MQITSKNSYLSAYSLNEGALVVCEGIDGSGKSTLLRGLAQFFSRHGLPVIETKEPGGTSLGVALRSIVQHHKTDISPLAELFLFASDRAQHCAELVKPALAERKLVFSDRMADSSRAYQGFGRGIDKNLLETIITYALQGVNPDIVFYCALDSKTAYERIRARNEKLTRFEQEKIDFYDRVIMGFEVIFKDRKDVIRLDATKSPEEMLEEAAYKLSEHLKDTGKLEIKNK